MSMQNFVDNAVQYLQTPIGWVVLGLLLAAAIMLLRGPGAAR